MAKESYFKYNLLIVDDDRLTTDAIKNLVPDHWKCIIISDIENQQIPAPIFHAAIIDLHLTNNLNLTEGLDVINKIYKQNPKIEIIAMSGDLSIELMEKCLNCGASRFFAKPVNATELISSLEKIEALWQMRDSSLRQNRRQNIKWVGNSQQSESIKRSIAFLRGETGPVLIEGETGTGKEVVAHLLNQQEPHRPFVAVNIASIPEGLFESELFGHVRGSFTNAVNHKVGLCEAAHGGDLFLDEIEALPLPLQVKMLRFLETGEVRRVGSKDSAFIKCRTIVASNQSLQKLVQENKFRDDLYFRLTSHVIKLPPLRVRKEDIEELAAHFILELKPRVNKAISSEGLLALYDYHWPGNVRELKRVCEQLALISPLPIIRSEDIQRLIQPSTIAKHFTTIDYSKGLDKLISEFETLILKCAHEQENGDLQRMSQLLKVPQRILTKKMKENGIL